MFRLAKVLLTIAAFVPAVPGAAQAPTPTTAAFDGIYVGVSRTSEGTTANDGATRTVQGNMYFGGGSSHCAPDGVPAPLRIVNGIARSRYGRGSDGSVSPQGVLLMRTRDGTARFEGGIDGKGTAAGRLIGGCSYWFVWQKKGQ